LNLDFVDPIIPAYSPRAVMNLLMLATHEPKPMEHVQDSEIWEFFSQAFGDAIEIHLPKVFGFQITKYMLLELLAAGLILAIYIPLARRSANGALPKGPWWNAFESLLTFIRNEVAKPNLGDHEADRFVPFLWTLFLFILFCNLLGLFPFLGSPTASIWMTAGLAICSFIMLHAPAIAKKGLWGYLKSIWPHIDVPYVGIGFSALIFVIEMFGTVIKSFVLAVRLFANMFAGHMVLVMLLMFILEVGKNGFSLLWSVVTVSSVLGVAALSLLELFVAFLQAYVFTFLTALFMGMSLHPEH
jgi:F-type H+-transporting ATPase subunit a